MARKGTNRRSNGTNKRRYSANVKGSGRGKGRGRTTKRSTRRARVGQRGGYGKSAYHHAIAMVGDATIQKNDSLASAYR